MARLTYVIYLIHDIYLSLGGGNFLFSIHFNHMWAVSEKKASFTCFVLY